MTVGRALLSATLLAICTSPASAQVLRADALTTKEFEALDRGRTAVIVPAGILEEHGPFLPAGSDIYQAGWLADALARRIAGRPGWKALVLPLMPFGHSGANDIARRWVYPGTITIRAETLRAVYMDLADALGQHGFRYVFLVDVHGAPDHNRMLDEAAEYFADTWGGTMVPLMGLRVTNTQPDLPRAIVSEAAVKSNGFTVHAGLLESSRVLFVKPDQIHPGLFTAPALTAGSFDELVALSRTSRWTGYWGAPATASTTIGAASMEQTLETIAGVARAVLDGQPWNRERFYVEANMDAADVQISRESAARETGLHARQQAWLRKKGLAR